MVKTYASSDLIKLALQLALLTTSSLAAIVIMVQLLLVFRRLPPPPILSTQPHPQPSLSQPTPAYPTPPHLIHLIHSPTYLPTRS